jgi:hypothetical protein
MNRLINHNIYDYNSNNIKRYGIPKEKYLFYVNEDNNRNIEDNNGNIEDNEESYKGHKINILCIILTCKY